MSAWEGSEFQRRQEEAAAAATRVNERERVSHVPRDLDLGQVAEGVIEIDPMTGRMVVRSEVPEGFTYLDVQEALARYEGQQVRVVIVPFTTINRVAELVESGAIQPDQVPTAGRR